VPVALVGSKKKGSDRWVERAKRFSASKCPKYYGSSRSIGIKPALARPVALSRRWRKSASARAFSPKPALQRPPDARAGIALALPPPAPPVTDASWHTGGHPAALSDRVGHLAQLKIIVCCLQAPTHRHPPPTTTLPSLHYLPSSPTSDPPPTNDVPPAYLSCLTTFPTRSAKTGGRHVVHYPLPPVAAASPDRPSRVAPPSPPPRPPVATASPARPRRVSPPSPPPRPPVTAASPHRRRPPATAIA